VVEVLRVGSEDFDGATAVLQNAGLTSRDGTPTLPATRDPRPANCNPRPANCNPQPATCNPQPATCNPQPATRNPQPATRNLQPATCNLQPATRAQPTTRNPRPATRNPRPATRNPRLATRNPGIVGADLADPQDSGDEPVAAETKIVMLTATLPPSKDNESFQQMRIERDKGKMFKAPTARTNVAYRKVKVGKEAKR
jgi:hypothetical protein